MARPISVNIPHGLGKDEARRRIESGFGRLREQISGGLAGVLAFRERWEGDCLHFESGALGQKITGRLDVQSDSVNIQLDLPDFLAGIAERLTGKLQQEARRLLEKK